MPTFPTPKTNHRCSALRVVIPMVCAIGFATVAPSLHGALQPTPNRSQKYDFHAMLQPLPCTAVFSDSDYNIWCGSTVNGDEGNYHLFYSHWPSKLGHVAWLTHSEVAHTMSLSPLGPFKKHDGQMFGAKAVTVAAEDPFIWHDGAGYRAIVKDNHGIFTRKLSALERPQVLIETSQPIPLHAARAEPENRDESFDMQIPLEAN